MHISAMDNLKRQHTCIPVWCQPYGIESQGTWCTKSILALMDFLIIGWSLSTIPLIWGLYGVVFTFTIPKILHNSFISAPVTSAPWSESMTRGTPFLEKISTIPSATALAVSLFIPPYLFQRGPTRSMATSSNGTFLIARVTIGSLLGPDLSFRWHG